MSDVIIGVIGFGTVGKGVVKILLRERAMLEQRTGSTVRLKKIADLDVTSDRGIELPRGCLPPTLARSSMIPRLTSS
jgi:homoserine dehydrogenase